MQYIDLQAEIEKLQQKSWWNDEMLSPSYQSWLERTIMRKLPVTRGYRNNNPGNIRLTKTQWKGMCEKQNDGTFCQFTDITWGFRAMLRLLNSYYYNYHLRSVREVIGRWAPGSDGNNVKAYARRVCVYANVTPAQRITAPDLDRGLWCNIVLGMATVENGVNQEYDDEYLRYRISKAWDMLFKPYERT